MGIGSSRRFVPLSQEEKDQQLDRDLQQLQFYLRHNNVVEFMNLHSKRNWSAWTFHFLEKCVLCGFRFRIFQFILGQPFNRILFVNQFLGNLMCLAYRQLLRHPRRHLKKPRHLLYCNYIHAMMGMFPDEVNVRMVRVPITAENFEYHLFLLVCQAPRVTALFKHALLNERAMFVHRQTCYSDPLHDEIIGSSINRFDPLRSWVNPIEVCLSYTDETPVNGETILSALFCAGLIGRGFDHNGLSLPFAPVFAAFNENISQCGQVKSNNVKRRQRPLPFNIKPDETMGPIDAIILLRIIGFLAEKCPSVFFHRCMCFHPRLSNAQQKTVLTEVVFYEWVVDQISKRTIAIKEYSERWFVEDENFSNTDPIFIELFITLRTFKQIKRLMDYSLKHFALRRSYTLRSLKANVESVIEQDPNLTEEEQKHLASVRLVTLCRAHVHRLFLTKT